MGEIKRRHIVEVPTPLQRQVLLAQDWFSTLFIGRSPSSLWLCAPDKAFRYQQPVAGAPLVSSASSTGSSVCSPPNSNFRQKSWTSAHQPFDQILELFQRRVLNST